MFERVKHGRRGSVLSELEAVFALAATEHHLDLNSK